MVHPKKRRARKAALFCSVLTVILAVLAAVFFFYRQDPAMTPAEREAFRAAKHRVAAYAAEHGSDLSDYPDDLILLLARNPETERFVLDYPREKDVNHVVDVSGEIGGAVPLFLQWDKRWGYKTYGGNIAGLTACGPVCLSMVAVYLLENPALSPDNVIDFAIREGYYSYGSGSKWTLISEGAGKLGLTAVELPLDENRIARALKSGHPVICAMGPGDFTTTGHFIVLTGLGAGGFTVNDPNSRANSEKIWSMAQISGQIRNLWEIKLPD